MQMRIGRYKIEGSGRNIKLNYNKYGAIFKYRGSTYHLKDFQPLGNGELADNGFSGFILFNAFSGIIIKIISDDYIQAYWFNTGA